jgi:hypothetical protein
VLYINHFSVLYGRNITDILTYKQGQNTGQYIFDGGVDVQTGHCESGITGCPSQGMCIFTRQPAPTSDLVFNLLIVCVNVKPHGRPCQQPPLGPCSASPLSKFRTIKSCDFLPCGLRLLLPLPKGASHTAFLLPCPTSLPLGFRPGSIFLLSQQSRLLILARQG